MENEALDQEEFILEKRPAELCQIKDYAVLMEIAGSYLCEEAVLRRLADGIQDNLESLKDYVYRVRRKFVGKPVHEIDITGPYDGIENLARSIRHPDEATKEKFREGKIGSALMEASREMAAAIEELTERVQGRTDKYRKRDFLIQLYDRVKFLAHSVVTTYKVLTRIVLAVLAAAVITFVILFATMETEKDVLVEVGNVKAMIEEKHSALSKVSRLISETLQEVRSLENKGEELGRDDKVKLIELKLREHTLKQKKEKIQIEIQREESILDSELKRLDEIKKKSFIRRLLRMS